MRLRARLVALIFLPLLATGCLSTYEPVIPDPAAASTKQTQEKVQGYLTPEAFGLDPAAVKAWNCDFEWLGMRNEDWIGTSKCAWQEGGQQSTFTVPTRVTWDGRVQTASDGAAYADTVKEMFGPKFGDWYLHRGEH